MRSAFREHLDSFAHDLILMCDSTAKVLSHASKGLTENSLEDSEQALSMSDELNELRDRCTDRAVELLAREAPVARDLRQIVSSIYIVEDLDRMATLAIHIASTARRRHPELVVEEPIMGYFREMGRLCQDMTAQIHDLLIDPDADVALTLSTDDDAVDDLHVHIMSLLTNREWPHSVRQAVDVALLSRYYERFADHTVNVAGQIVYLTSGLKPAQYTDQKSAEAQNLDFQRRLGELERQLGR
ncbi:phosphate signaling complex protein PhoU [Corynebacterium kozikiae]|uniref:phosphate signaling complex protein PhoU n=1 Tax=Corynebacterium kozikiae TaxID=2968469 RepID=UPI00211C65BC|nr:phosphate signaling complex protein PhoU [Corynebacterium sp. 76QC2CO]MCQ9343683.1 phosphate signaling complex protein PhoU [Corynebacterium sp. 76QC2CO]